jgi:hypothetical protein
MMTRTHQPTISSARLAVIALLMMVVCALPGCLKRGGDFCDDPGFACDDAAGYGCYASPLPDTPLVFVHPLAPREGADGTIEHPYPTINDGLEAAEAGDTVVLSAGTYEESVRLDEPVDLVGAGASRTTIHSEDERETLALVGINGTTIAGVTLKGDGGLGLLVTGCTGTTIRDTAVSEYDDGEDYPGVGVYVIDSKSIRLDSMDINNNLLYGLVFSGSEATTSSSSVSDNGNGGTGAGIVVGEGSSVTIGPQDEPDGEDVPVHQDITEDDTTDSDGKADAPGNATLPESAAAALEVGGCAVVDTDGIGILVQQSRVAISQTAVVESMAGGIALDGATLDSGAADSTAETGSVLDHVLVQDSKMYGIAQFGGCVTVTDSLVRGVYFPDGDGSMTIRALGISVTARDGQAPQTEIIGSTIEDCEGPGILIDKASSGEWTGPNSLLSDVEVRASSLSGIWIQGESRADVINCSFEEVELVGLAYTGNSEGLAYGNQFVSVRTGYKPDFDLNKNIEMADAIYLSRLSNPNTIAIQENTILEVERNGVIIDDSNAGAFFYASNGAAPAVSAFSGNIVADGAVTNGDEFAFQGNCKGFDGDTVSMLLQKGASFVDPKAKDEVKAAPCVGKAALSTAWETATDFDVK